MRGPQKNQQAVAVYAKSVYRELKGQGYSRDQIVAFASEMLELLTIEARTADGAEPGSAESAA